MNTTLDILPKKSHENCYLSVKPHIYDKLKIYFHSQIGALSFKTGSQSMNQMVTEIILIINFRSHVA